ncbi:autophagy-related protein 29 [Aspergillus nomiae NRRL 13137]|uniref:Autophagy-related protein 29 n=1 Tax=Aspergillus nomiae NRRL (strain ATCC 15546 / NRRL 13137 / CBS 260.88 / M93) TaxID=1509407 RepID=A0A0L1IR69_ASPN3|nr:autophagy-related protein 29 [Aspergillus nomiae NRRL 13137]KNG81964.1 autophagy-related protein 29 [Aspergillus nomiae NRRL 13137]
MTSLNQSGDTNFTVSYASLFLGATLWILHLQAEWNAAKDQALWDLLSRPSKGDDIDWKALAERFDVTLQFLLQQAAWLYDRQLSQVRAQMRKVGTTQSSSPSPAPGSVSGSTALGGQSAKGGLGAAPRVPSRLSSQQKDTLPQRGPPPRRTSSATTVNQIKISKESPCTETPAEFRDPRWESVNRRSSASKRDQAPVPPAPVHKSPTLQEEDLSSSSPSSSSDEDDGLASRRGLRFRRFGKFSTHRPGLRDDDEEDEDDPPAFLPLSRAQPEAARDPSAQDLNETLRLQGEDQTGARRRTSEQSPVSRESITTESSTSSVSSGAPVAIQRRVNSIPSPLSPRRTAELARASPRRMNNSGRDTSDGTPSMESSFSELDDTSVTESALQEALLSNMQHGGMASRMSTISQAIRSRYFDG